MIHGATVPLTPGIPTVCTVADVCRILRLSQRQFFALRAAGRFPIPEILPRLDRRPRFRGIDVQRYLSGEFQQRRRRA